MGKLFSTATRPVAGLVLLLAVALAPLQHGLAQGTMVLLSPANGNVEVNETITVDIRIENVNNLYGAEVHLSFDPALLEVVDANEGTSGVQITPGSFLLADFLAVNDVDNENGRINFAVSQMPPHAAVSGSGILATITFKGKAAGTSNIAFTSAVLSDSNGGALTAGTQDGTLAVNSPETPTPLPSATPRPTPTSPTSNTPTPTPTTAPTAPPPPTATPAPAGEILGYHVVRSGETLYCIGRAYRVDPYAIARVNGILNPNVIYAGMRLAIPNAPASLPAGTVCEQQFNPARTCQAYHTIVAGENLYRIALHYGVSMWAIAEANNILNLNYIVAGQVLCIP